MADNETTGRPNQRQRTRKDLLQAAARLLKQGHKPTLDEIAAEALVSRATAYRYFPNVEALLAEAPLDEAMLEAADLFRDAPADDAVARIERIDAMLEDIMRENETSLRMMLAQSMHRALRNGEDGDELPVRQNRRTPLIEAALEPVRHQFKPGALKNLTRALALVFGTEAMVVFKDVLRVDAAEARKVRRWAIRALVEAARKDRKPTRRAAEL